MLGQGTKMHKAWAAIKANMIKELGSQDMMSGLKGSRGYRYTI